VLGVLSGVVDAVVVGPVSGEVDGAVPGAGWDGGDAVPADDGTAVVELTRDRVVEPPRPEPPERSPSAVSTWSSPSRSPARPVAPTITSGAAHATSNDSKSRAGDGRRADTGRNPTYTIAIARRGSSWKRRTQGAPTWVMIGELRATLPGGSSVPAARLGLHRPMAGL
jgi:hypothetical protein